MTNCLKVSQVATFLDRNEQSYKKVTFNAIQILDNGVTVQSPKTATRILYPTREVDGKVINGFDLDVKVGDILMGSIVRFTTQPYPIKENVVNHTTVVVFDGENGIKIALNQLKQYNVGVIDEDGVLHSQKRPVAATATLTPTTDEDDAEF
jgi:hypothetical protein